MRGRLGAVRRFSVGLCAVPWAVGRVLWRWLGVVWSDEMTFLVGRCICKEKKSG